MRDSSPILDPSIKLVVFDHDDTLVRTIKPKWAQHKYIAKEFYSRELTDEHLRKHWGKPFTSLLRHLYATDHIDIAMSYNIATRKMFPKELFKETVPTLKALKAQGKKLAIVTATIKSSISYDFETLGIDKKLFDYIQTQDDSTYHKPHPRVLDPLRAWMKKKKIDPSEVLSVGDHYDDMQPSQAAGFKFIGIGTGFIPREEFLKKGVPTIRKLSDLLEGLTI